MFSTRKKKRSRQRLKFRIWHKLKLTYKCEGCKNTAPRALKVADMWIPFWKGSVGKSQAMTWSVNTATPKRQTSFRVIGSHETVSQDLAPRCDTNQITRIKVLVRRSLSKLLPSTDKTQNLGKKNANRVTFDDHWPKFHVISINKTVERPF